jgi:2-phosphoglycerate kinase
MEIGVSGNLKWLVDVSKEFIPGLKAIVDRHIEDNVPIIIEGDFIDLEFALSYKNKKTKSIFLNESDKNQIMENFLEREGGDLQEYRAETSIAYGNWIQEKCNEIGLKTIESRPWSTLLKRAIEYLK